MLGDYNLAACQITIGDFRVTGWGASDGAKVTPMSDLMESEASGDGAHVVASRKNDPRHELTMKVQWGTTAMRELYEKATDQKKEGAIGPISALAFQLFDPNTQTKIVESQLRFVRLPDLTLGQKVGELEFKCLLPNPDITVGAGISLSG